MAEKLLIAPVAKVDAAKREVWGYATLEVPDKTTPIPDLMDYESATQAFGRWPGNVREMHLPVAVGKGIAVTPDPEKRGVYIGARISKSRDGEDVWTKIEEGVLTAFSIGAKGVTRTPETVTFEGKSVHVNRLKVDSIVEVSLVDNPACPGTQFSVAKADEPEPAPEPAAAAAEPAPDAAKAEPPAEPSAEPSSVTADVLKGLQGVLAGFANRGDVTKLAADITEIRTDLASLMATVEKLVSTDYATTKDVEAVKALSADRAAASAVTTISEDLAKTGLVVEVLKADLDALVRRIETVERTPMAPRVALRTEELAARGLAQAQKAALPEPLRAVHEEIAALEKRIDETTDPFEKDRLGAQAGLLRMRTGLL